MPTPTVLSGSRGTGNESGLPALTSINPTRRVLDVSEKIHLLDNDNNPLVIFTKKAGKKETINPKFRWQEDRFEPKAVTLDATALAALGAAGTTFTLPTASEAFYLTVGDLLIFPSTAGAAPDNYDEIMLITAVSADGLDITVSRNFGSRNAAADVTGETAPYTAYILGSAFAEGSSAATPKSTRVTFKDNFTEIFKDTFSVTGTENASELYGGADRPRLRRKKAMKHMRDIERAFILGQPKEDVTLGNYARRATAGVLYYITTNVSTVGGGGTLNYQTWVDFAEDVFRYGESSTRLLLSSAEVVSAIDMMAHNTYFTMAEETVHGVKVKRVVTSHGDFLVVRHKQFGEMGLNGYGIALDMQDVRYRYLRGRDTMFEPDIQQPGDDVMTDQYLTEAGLEFPLEERSGVLKGVTGFAP